MIVKNTFFGTFFRLGGGLKVVKIKKNSISDSATQKLSKDEKKNPWCDPLKGLFYASNFLNSKINSKIFYERKR